MYDYISLSFFCFSFPSANNIEEMSAKPPQIRNSLTVFNFTGLI